MSEFDLKLDRDLCQGYANCVMVAPDLFDLDDGGLAVLLAERMTPDLLASAEQAVESCPAQAIALTPR